MWGLEGRHTELTRGQVPQPRIELLPGQAQWHCPAQAALLRSIPTSNPDTTL